jgi:hypothetical protein
MSRKTNKDSSQFRHRCFSGGTDGQEKGTCVNITVSEETTAKAVAIAGRVVDAVLDTFSPVTKGLGAVGDSIDLYRQRIKIYKEAAVTATLKRVKQIASKENIRLELPPPKFMVPYLESASLEDEDDVSLREKWVLGRSGVS